jgi:uncharacterized protein YbcI
MSDSSNSVHLGPARQTISRGIVALIKENTGRGPTNARAYIEDDMVTVLLQETLTKVERTLTEAGSGEVVSTMREQFDGVMCADAVSIVERATGRPVEAFVSGHAIEPDYSVFCFVLAPEEGKEEEAAPCDSPGLGKSEEPLTTA